MNGTPGGLDGYLSDGGLRGRFRGACVARQAAGEGRGADDDGVAGDDDGVSKGSGGGGRRVGIGGVESPERASKGPREGEDEGWEEVVVYDDGEEDDVDDMA